ncbi:hypothetical protein [[Enterobacter] lignolyticus]|uniref:hypothetical protein n=1 Tax=[Enterobacter] lignolyticus TaxID=1334193 RepID=UPI000309749A|nr:hypothetical protein [[Enterobacter] lignolyticus]
MFSLRNSNEKRKYGAGIAPVLAAGCGGIAKSCAFFAGLQASGLATAGNNS